MKHKIGEGKVPRKQERCNNHPEGTRTTWSLFDGNQTRYPLQMITD